MGKHKSSLQDSIMLSFMENNHDMAKGFIKGDKAKSDLLWRELVEKMNSHGPPIKDVVGWKKVWIDWKAMVRKKIAHNNSEARATGGGPFNKYVLTPTEGKIGEICGIFKVVEGIENTYEFGQPDNEEVASNDENENSSAHPTPIPSRDIAVTPKRRREPSFNEYIKKYIGEKSNAMASMADDLKKIAKEKELIRAVKDIKYQLKEFNCNFKKLNETLVNNAEQEKRYHFKMQALREEELQIKRMKLELQEMKINMLSKEKNPEV